MTKKLEPHKNKGVYAHADWYSDLSIKSNLKRFLLHRALDNSGISGTGIVAEGIKLSDGRVVLNWVTEPKSIGIFNSAEEMMKVHGHGGKTILLWID